MINKGLAVIVLEAIGRLMTPMRKTQHFELTGYGICYHGTDSWQWRLMQTEGSEA
ncbi:MAG: hypothetical protein HGB02_03870 [Chlorobiaceae bacterium]|nr:hypothetical protein [Chlorobiaceae bacterium]